MFKRGVIVSDSEWNVIGEYESIAACADALGIGHTAVWNRLNGVTKGKDRVFKYAERPPKQPLRKSTGRPKKIAVNGECQELPYEMRNGVICITPCPFKKELMVASARCKKCYNFGGMDRDKRILYCRCKAYHR